MDRHESSSEELIRRARESVYGDPGEPDRDHRAVAPPGSTDDTSMDVDPTPAAPSPTGAAGTAADPFTDLGAGTRRRPRRPKGVPGDQATTATPPQEVDFRRGVALAAGAALLGAVAWGGLLAYAELQSWLLGIGIGWLVGTAAIRGAGRLTTELKFVVAALAIAAVVVGEVLGVALFWHKELGFFNLAFAVETYFGNLDQLGGDFLFALGGGALGAWVAVTQDSRTAR